MVSLNKYNNHVHNNKENPSPFKFPKINSIEFNTKILYDQNIKYNYEYDILYYDLESMTTDNRFASLDNPHAIVSIIQMRHVIEGKRFDIVYTLKKYAGTYNLSKIHEQHKGVIIKHFESEQLLCIHFLAFLQQLKRTTIVTGFYSSGTFINNITKADLKELDESNPMFAALKTKSQLGFDLPFVIERSTQSGNLHIYKSVKKLNGQMYVQIKQILELPACIFIDAQLLLIQALTPDQRVILKDNSLNSFCELHGVESKNDMSYEEMNNILKANKTDTTKVFKYAIQDVVVLDKLFTKLDLFNKTIEHAKTCCCSIMDAFHKTGVCQLLQ